MDATASIVSDNFAQTAYSMQVKGSWADLHAQLSFCGALSICTLLGFAALNANLQKSIF